MMSEDAKQEREDFVTLHNKFLALEAADFAFEGDGDEHWKIGRERYAVRRSVMLAPVADARSIVKKLAIISNALFRDELETEHPIFIAALQQDVLALAAGGSQ